VDSSGCGTGKKMLFHYAKPCETIYIDVALEGRIRLNGLLAQNPENLMFTTKDVKWVPR
jgi:hypothetical protein